jgi:hypothetical protein
MNGNKPIHAIVYGHAVADALGVPVEFKSRDTLQADPVTGMRAYGTHHMPAGTWSDDTSMALATMDSLAHGIDYEDCMSRFARWTEHAAYTATDEVFDIGITSKRTAYLLDTFSCVFQGIIPYGAQMLVAISACAEMGVALPAFNIMQFLFYPSLLLVSCLLAIYVFKAK